MKPPSNWAHLRDILILPGMVCVVIPYLLNNIPNAIIPHSGLIRQAGAVVFIIGLVLWAYPVFLFRTIGMGTLAPWAPTQKLIVTGPYLYCRNPMITGILFILAGEGLWLWSLPILAWATWFFIMNTLYFRFLEEPGLVKRFGDDYIRYRQNVPMWIPRLKPYRLQK
jgi:protein-S-isoprenylcysteine O-methyltransferase Ste14